MVKTIVLIKRKPGLTQEEFVRRYEEVHAPLALKHNPTIRKHVRNHVTTLQTPPANKELGFDCITEVWFDDTEASKAGLQTVPIIYPKEYDKLLDSWMSAEAAQAIREDEESFMDRSKIVLFQVDERVSVI